MLAKYNAICEWRISNIATGEFYCENVARLVRASVKKIMANMDGLLKRAPEAVHAVAEGLILSGVAMDFVKEDGAWKIWHLRAITDFSIRPGSSWVTGNDELPFGSLPDDTAFQYPLYSAERPLILEPRLPEPYEHFCQTFSYGAERRQALLRRRPGGRGVALALCDSQYWEKL